MNETSDREYKQNLIEDNRLNQDYHDTDHKQDQSTSKKIKQMEQQDQSINRIDQP